ncbi:uncharacterized protein V1513DRAFT_19002 [Lipomyces chichibuensis]|uniref:uncharacterized protein n=1 Tax=Lipomyces chichibuensis TaxID=1546026 RepID=UPI00334336FE
MATIRVPELSFAESYRLMKIARSKLSRAVNTGDHDLRVLVSHANLLDALMAHLDRKDVPVTSSRRTGVYDVQEASEYSNDSDSDSDGDSDCDSDCDCDCDCDSDCDSDDEDNEEYLLVPSHGRTLSPIPERSHENSDAEDDDDILEPLHELRSQLYASSSENKRSVTFSPDLVERTPRDSRQVQFSVREIHRERKSNNPIAERHVDYFADNDDDDYTDEDDDLTFYEVANMHKYESTENESDNDMPPLIRVKSHVENPHALPEDEQLDEEPPLPQLTDTTTASDDDDLDGIIALSPRDHHAVPANSPVSGHSIKEVDMFTGTPEAAHYAMSWVA